LIENDPIFLRNPLPKHNEAIRVREIRPPEQKGVHNRENERGAPNPESENKDNRGSKKRGLTQAAQSEPQILPARFEKITKARGADLLFYLLDSAQLERRGATSGFLVETAAFFCRCGKSEIRIDLLSQIALDLVLAPQVARERQEFRNKSHR
jgi:hypothetical protein